MTAVAPVWLPVKTGITSPAEPQDFLGSVESHTEVTADTWNVLQYIEHEDSKGKLDYLFRHSACFHCTDAACESVCPEDAISYTQFGTVVIDHEKCVGSGYCVKNCPFDVSLVKNTLIKTAINIVKQTNVQCVQIV